jgi:poly(A) polymerase
MEVLEELTQTSSWYYAGFSALDRYFGTTSSEQQFIAVEGDLVTLAKAVPELDFPGIYHADAAAWIDGVRTYFTTFDPGSRRPQQSFRPLNLLYSPARERYIDPYDDYQAIRSEVLEPAPASYSPLHRLLDAAMAISRYSYTLAEPLTPVEPFPELPPETLRSVLTTILTGTSADRGMELLMEHGFVERYLPELMPMCSTSHSKEHHPEGGVWSHSVQTFRYRRGFDLRLTWALLLHDSGKPLAVPSEGRRFNGHAEIGARLARRILRRLNFPQEFIDDVSWLIERHMFPGALHKLPTFRTARLMDNRLFPLLLELYRCDLVSTYRGPDGYYRACKIYRDFLRNNANPYRDASGKKLIRLYVE